MLLVANRGKIRVKQTVGYRGTPTLCGPTMDLYVD